MDAENILTLFEITGRRSVLDLACNSNKNIRKIINKAVNLLSGLHEIIK